MNMKERLEDIENQLITKTYRVGAWQKLVADLDLEPIGTRREMSEKISQVSVRLHGRNGFPTLPFVPVYGMEVGLLLLAFVLIQGDTFGLDLLGCVLLGATAQPVMKVTTGLVMGLRYEYAFLWYFEPRFKMQFGRYLCLPSSSRVVLHLFGSVGTPLALGVAWLQLTPHYEWLGLLALLGCVVTAVMQVGAFVAEMMGVRRVGRFRLSQLTSPATAAFEWKKRHKQQA